jgi:hypothetical protein
MTTALEGGEGSASRPGRSLPPGKTVPIVQEAGWAPGPVWRGAEYLATTRIRSPDRQARSQSLYRLSYPPPCPNDGWINMAHWWYIRDGETCPSTTLSTTKSRIFYIWVRSSDTRSRRLIVWIMYPIQMSCPDNLFAINFGRNVNCFFQGGIRFEAEICRIQLHYTA